MNAGKTLMKALIIDDSQAMRQIVKRFVSRFGFEVIEAGDGMEGIGQMKKHPDIDLVLVDWHMPGVDGVAFVELVRKELADVRLPIVMITSETEPKRIIRALMAGVDEFLTKPFSPDLLRQKLEMVGIAVDVVDPRLSDTPTNR
jgi:two-component system chemotaxis response regulator CheY